MTIATAELEKARLEFEKYRFDSELKLKERALELDKARHKDRTFSASQATVAGAIIALLSGVVGASIESWSNERISDGSNASLVAIEKTKVEGSIDIEESKQEAAAKLARDKFESTLILKAIETESRREAVRNLGFFLRAGIISDEGGKIAGLEDYEFPSLTDGEGENMVSDAISDYLISNSSGEDELRKWLRAREIHVGNISNFLTHPRFYSHRIDFATDFKLVKIISEYNWTPAEFYEYIIFNEHARNQVFGEKQDNGKYRVELLSPLD